MYRHEKHIPNSLKSLTHRAPGVSAWRMALCTLCAALMPALGWGWSQKGHDTVAHIAERHLTPAAAAAVDSLLEGKSLVYWANWLDNASHTPEYEYSKTWHYKNIDADETYDKSYVNPKGDILRALEAQTALLSDPSASAKDKTLALKMVTHLMGDLHQPMHMGHYTDLGGNKIDVKFFDTDRNLHSVWDGSLVESGHKWSYTEWADQIDRATPALEAILLEGTINDWGRETYSLCSEVYATTPEGTRIEYNYIAKWTPIIEQQLLKGGLRLAHLLNQAFDPAYTVPNQTKTAPAEKEGNR